MAKKGKCSMDATQRRPHDALSALPNSVVLAPSPNTTMTNSTDVRRT